MKQKHGTRIRIIPSGTSIGRILPLTQRKAQYAFLASGTFFGSEGTYDFADQQWGPQDLRCVLAPPSSGRVRSAIRNTRTQKDPEGRETRLCQGQPFG